MKKITLLNLIFLCVFGVARSQDCNVTSSCTGWYVCGGLTANLGTDCMYDVPDLVELTCLNSAAAVSCFQGNENQYSIRQEPVAGTSLAGEHDVPVNFTVILEKANSEVDTICVTVTPIDTTSPALSCPPTDVTLTLDENCEYTIPDYTDLMITDCTEPFMVDQDPDPGTLPGTHGLTEIITVTVTDNADNSSTCTINAFIQDEEAPLIEFDLSQNFDNVNTNGMMGGDVACFAETPLFDVNGMSVNITPSISDDCSFTTSYIIRPPMGADIEGSGLIPAGTQFDLGISTIVYCADDGATEVCDSIEITVVDGVAPIFDACPTNVDAFLDNNGEYSTTILDLTGTDNCDPANELTISYFPSNFDCDDIGPASLLVSLNDGSMNSDSAVCNVTVTVRDTINPVCIDLDEVYTVVMDANGEGSISPSEQITILDEYRDPDNEADNCVSNSLTIEFGVVSCPPVGMSTLEIVVNDGHENNPPNTTVCMLDVNVVDNSPPTMLECPPPESYESDDDCTATIEVPSPTAIDNCGSITYTFSFIFGQDEITGEAGDMATFPTGETTVTYTATDEAGNTATCTTDITVTDGSEPNAICKEYYQVELIEGEITIQAEELDGGSTDPCPNTNFIFEVNGEEELTIECGNLDEFPDTLTYILDVFDSEDGNMSSCTATVVVQDLSKPECPDVTLSTSASPDDIITQADLESLDPQPMDNCGISVIEINPHPPFSCTISDTTVTYSIFDLAGNEEICDLDVAIMDNLPPVLHDCPDPNTPIEILLDDEGNATITAGQFGIAASDNCIDSLDLVIELDPSEVDCDNLGETVITASVTAGGQTVECEFSIDVKDVTMPTFECASQTFEIETGGVFVLDEADIRSLIGNPNDACSEFDDWTVSATPLAFDCDMIGTNDVVITVEDEAGNERNISCSFTLEGLAFAHISGPLAGVCEESSFTLTEDSNNPDNPNVAWDWYLDGVSLNFTEQELTISSAQQIHKEEFTVIVTAENGCTAEASFTIPDIWLLPTADFVVVEEIVDAGEPQSFINESEAPEIGASIISRILCFSRQTEDMELDDVLPEMGFHQVTWDTEGAVEVTLKVEDSNGCTAELTKDFTVGNICTVKLDDDVVDDDEFTVCLGASTISDLDFLLHFGSGDLGGEFKIYALEDGVNLSNDSTQCFEKNVNCPEDCELVTPDNDDNFEVSVSEISFDEAGEYHFVVEWDITCPFDSCDSKDEFTIFVIPEPQVMFSLREDSLCEGSDVILDYSFTEGFVEGETHTIEYKINENTNFFNTTNSSGSIIIEGLDVMQYTIEVIDVNNTLCSWLDTYIVEYEIFSEPIITTTQSTLVTEDDGENITMCIRLSELGGTAPFTVEDQINSLNFVYDAIEDAYCLTVLCEPLALDVLVTDAIGCNTSQIYNVTNDNCDCKDLEKDGAIAAPITTEICLGSSLQVEITEASQDGSLRSTDSILLVMYDSDANINDENGWNNPIWFMGVDNVTGVYEIPASVFMNMDASFIGQRLSVARIVGKPNPSDSFLLEVEGGACFTNVHEDFFVLALPEISDVPESICPGEEITLGFTGTVKEGSQNQQFRVYFTKWENNSPELGDLPVTFKLIDEEIQFTVTETGSTDSIVINSISYEGLDVDCEVLLDEAILVLSQAAAQIEGDFQVCLGQQGSVPYSAQLPDNASNITWTFSPTPTGTIFSEDSSTVWVRWPENGFSEGDLWSVILSYGSTGLNACAFTDSVNATFNSVTNPLRELILKGNDLANPEVMIYPNLADNGSVAYEHYCFGRTLKEDLFTNPSGTKLEGYDDSNVPSYNFSNQSGAVDTNNWAYWVEVLPRNIAFADFSTCQAPNIACDTRVYANGILRVDRTSNYIPDGFLNFEVFPNPNHGEFIVKTTGAFEGSVHYELYNSLGVPIRTGIWDKLIPEQAFEMKIKEVPSGVYFIRLFDQEARLTEVQQIVIH